MITDRVIRTSIVLESSQQIIMYCLFQATIDFCQSARDIGTDVYLNILF